MAYRFISEELGLDIQGTDYSQHRLTLGSVQMAGMGAHEYQRYCEARRIPFDLSRLARPAIYDAWRTEPEFIAPVIPLFPTKQGYETGLEATGS